MRVPDTEDVMDFWIVFDLTWKVMASAGIVLFGVMFGVLFLWFLGVSTH